MALSSDLASQFAKVTNDSGNKSSGTKLYGTIKMLGEGENEIPHVKLDGTEELTPITRTVEVAEGDRVEVTIANHSATVTGNLTDPSIGIVRAGNLESKITQTASEIRLEVSDLEKNLRSSITQTAESIRSEVSDLDGKLSGNISTVETGIREDLSNGLASLSESLTQVETNTNNTFSDLNTTIDNLTMNITNLDSKITQTASEIRTEVSASVTDLSATITNNDTAVRETINLKVAELNTSISQTATSIRSEVSGKFETVDGNIKNLNTSITQNATSITSLVKEDEKFSTFMQTVNGFAFMNNGGTVKIESGSLNLTGSISFTDLNSTTQTRITTVEGNASTASTNANNALTKAGNALKTAGQAIKDASNAQKDANSAASLARAIAQGTYKEDNTTFISNKCIYSPTIYGAEIYAANNNAYTEVLSNGFAMYCTGDDDEWMRNPKVLMTYVNSSDPYVQLVLGAGSSSSALSTNRFYIEKHADYTSLLYNDSNSKKSGFNFKAGGVIEVIGTGIGTSTTVTAVWG